MTASTATAAADDVTPYARKALIASTAAMPWTDSTS